MTPNDLQDKLMDVLQNNARASAELAAAQRENVEHLKDLHDRSREQGVLLDKVVDRMQRMEESRDAAVSDILQSIEDKRADLEKQHEDIKKHVTAEVAYGSSKLAGQLKVLSSMIAFAATIIAAAIGFAAVMLSK